MWCPCAYSRVGKCKYRGKAREFHFMVNIISVFEFWMESVKTSGIFLLMMLNSTVECLVSKDDRPSWICDQEKEHKKKNYVDFTTEDEFIIPSSSCSWGTRRCVCDTCTYRTIPWELIIHPCNIFNERFPHQFILGTWERWNP